MWVVLALVPSYSAADDDGVAAEFLDIVIVLAICRAGKRSLVLERIDVKESKILTIYAVAVLALA